jgi:hypothetical protein
MDEANCFEMLINIQDTIRHHISGDGDVHKYRFVNVKYHRCMKFDFEPATTSKNVSLFNIRFQNRWIYIKYIICITYIS